jgi:Flp pilus assembly pilin Flp
MLTDVALRVWFALESLAARRRDDDGQTLAEYSLIISAVAVATVIVTVIAFREVLADTWNSVADCLNAIDPCN